MERDKMEKKRIASYRLASPIEMDKVKKWRCSMCGNDEWLCKVESYALHRICKRCGFEIKEMKDEVTFR